MQVPLQVTFDNVKKSDAVTTRVRERVRRLQRFFDSIVSCRVAIEQPHGHHGAGNHFRVRVELAVPGRKLVANREPDEHHAYTDVYVAIRDAFDAVRRQLEDYSRELRGYVKAHEPSPQGRIVERLQGEGRDARKG